MKESILSIVHLAFELYFYVLLARVVLSYLNSTVQMHPVSLFIFKLTEPLLRRLRSVIPDQTIGTLRIDVSLLLLLFVYKWIVGLVLQVLSLFLF